MAAHIGLAQSSDTDLEGLVRASGGQPVRVDLNRPDALKTSRLDVLIVDLRGHQRLPEGLNGFRKQHPQLGVIIVTAALEAGLILEALRAGVNECVSAPLKQDELTAAIDRVIGQRTQTQTTGQIFAFVGAKGGVGTTTIAVNTAAALAQESPGSTLLVDLHLTYGDAAVYLGAESRFSVLDALENTHRMDEAFLKGLVTHTSSGLDLLAAGDRAAPTGIDGARIQNLLEQASRLYRFVVIDVESADVVAMEALALARAIVIVANQELATVRNASRIAARLRQRYGNDRVQITITRADRHADIGHEDVEQAVGSKVRHRFASDYRLAVQAMNKGRPLALDNHSSLASSIKTFARELAGLNADDETSAAISAGLFSRLAGRRRT